MKRAATTAAVNAAHNRGLQRDIKRATDLVESNLKRMAPFLAAPVCAWMRRLSGTPRPHDYFLHPEAFPMFLLPYWVEKAVGTTPVRAFRRDVVYSTVNGYYYIRLMDDVMDGDGNAEPSILPTMNVFVFEFIRPYTIHFPPGHPFWEIMRETWFGSAEAATHDAMLQDIDATQFMNIAARKVCGVRIPIAAVCYYYDKPGMIPRWNALADTLGCWHQMLNDLFDWQKDLEHGNSTYLLSEGRRRARPRETMAEWVIREGFEWGIALLDDWMARLQSMAVELRSPGLSRYLRKRKGRLAERVEQIAAPVQAMQRLVAAVQRGR